MHYRLCITLAKWLAQSKGRFTFCSRTVDWVWRSSPTPSSLTHTGTWHCSWGCWTRRRRTRLACLSPAERYLDLWLSWPHSEPLLQVFIVGPDKKLKLSILYPATTGRNFRCAPPHITSSGVHGYVCVCVCSEVLRVVDSLQLTVNKKVATPADWTVSYLSSTSSLSLPPEWRRLHGAAKCV